MTDIYPHIRIKVFDHDGHIFAYPYINKIYVKCDM